MSEPYPNDIVFEFKMPYKSLTELFIQGNGWYDIDREAREWYVKHIGDDERLTSMMLHACYERFKEVHDELPKKNDYDPVGDEAINWSPQYLLERRQWEVKNKRSTLFNGMDFENHGEEDNE